MRAVVLAVCLLFATQTAHGDPWYRGERGKHRIIHLSLSAGFGLTYLAQVTVFKSALTADSCRWCEPGTADRAARRTLVWDDPKRADLYSSLDAYVLAPIVGGTLLYFSDKDASWGRLLDDVIPVAEAVAISQVLVASLKFAVGRTRPYAYYGSTTYGDSLEARLSFPSGHSSLGFALTSGAAMVAHWRKYKTEPYIWVSGVALSLSVEYLRIGADKHWLTDCLVGGGIGLASGIIVPTLLRKRAITIAPMPTGAAVVGRF